MHGRRGSQGADPLRPSGRSWKLRPDVEGRVTRPLGIPAEIRSQLLGLQPEGTSTEYLRLLLMLMVTLLAGTSKTLETVPRSLASAHRSGPIASHAASPDVVEVEPPFSTRCWARSGFCLTTLARKPRRTLSSRRVWHESCHVARALSILIGFSWSACSADASLCTRCKRSRPAARGQGSTAGGSPCRYWPT